MDPRWADEFRLNSAQMRFVQGAIPGNEKTGYSEALVGIDGDWRGIEVRAMEREKRVIDFDPKEQSRGELPGTESDGEVVEYSETKPGEGSLAHADDHSGSDQEADH